MIHTAAQICNDARALLLDADKAYWSDQELLDYLNNGRDMLYLGLPRLYQVTEQQTLVAGTLQTVPGASRFLFGLLRNVSADGSRSITPINRELLMRIRPGWRGEDQSDEILHYVYVETEPTVFETYPPAVAGTTVMTSYALPPARLALSGGALPATVLAEGEMARALQHYVLHMAYMKQSDASPDAGQRAGAELEKFQAFIQAEEVGKRDSSPNTLAIGAKPTEATNR